MLKICLYINFLILFVLSIWTFVRSVSKDNTKKTASAVLLILLTFFNLVAVGTCLDTGYELLLFYLVVLITIAVNIFSIIISVVKRKIKTQEPTVRSILALLVAPILMFVVPLCIELVLLYGSSFVLKFNYQNGIVESTDTYYAIVNGRSHKLSLGGDIVNKRGGVRYKFDKIYYYETKENDDGELVLQCVYGGEEYLDAADEIYQVAVKDHKGTSEAMMKYVPDVNISIIEMMHADGNYLVHLYEGTTKLGDLDTYGSLKEVIVY